MAKAKAHMANGAALQPAAPQSAAKPASTKFGGTVEKLKEFGKNAGEKAKAVGSKAKAHVSRNRAASIAGGAGLAAGAGGMAILNRKKQAQGED